MWCIYYQHICLWSDYHGVLSVVSASSFIIAPIMVSSSHLWSCFISHWLSLSWGVSQDLTGAYISGACDGKTIDVEENERGLWHPKRPTTDNLSQKLRRQYYYFRQLRLVQKRWWNIKQAAAASTFTFQKRQTGHTLMDMPPIKTKRIVMKSLRRRQLSIRSIAVQEKRCCVNITKNLSNFHNKKVAH